MSPIRRFLATTAMIGAVLAGAGCGRSSYAYVGSTSNQVFFKIPSTWQRFSPDEVSFEQHTILAGGLAGPAGGSLVWSAAYDASPTPSVSHMFDATSEPAVYVSVQVMNSALRSGLSFDLMRDLLLAVTPGRRSALAANHVPVLPTHVLFDAVLTSNDGVRGIGEQYAIQLRGGIQEYAQTVLTNSATTKLYLLLVQCDVQCFRTYRSQISAIIGSFTVKGP